MVLCVPGMGDLRSVYRFVLPTLTQRGYRAVAMDVRGMGDTTVKWSDYSEAAIGSDIIALIDHLDSGPATIVANSISAGAAVWAAAEAPQSVSSLVLIGPFVRNVPISAWKKWSFILALARPWGATVWVGYQAKALYPSTPPGDMADHSRSLKANLKEPGRMKAFQRMAATSHSAAEARLDRVRAPVMVVMGTADPDFTNPVEEANYIAKRLKGSVVLIDGAGHYPQAEVPGPFSAALLDFLSSQASRP